MGKLTQYFNSTFAILLALVLKFGIAQANLGVQLAPDSELSYEEEYRMFQEDDEDSSQLSRQKRFVYLNVDTNMAVALLIGVPLSFVLPSMSNLFNSWRRKRSIVDSSENNWTLQDDSFAKPEMEKLSTYFQLLDIPEASCQLRAVCEFSADPEKYYPLSDVILKRIRNPGGTPSLAYHEENFDSSNSSYLFADKLPRSQKKSLFELYNQAADEGQVHGFDRCHEKFANSCHYPIENLLNMPVIKFWSALQALLKLNFKDVSLK